MIVGKESVENTWNGLWQLPKLIARKWLNSHIDSLAKVRNILSHHSAGWPPGGFPGKEKSPPLPLPNWITNRTALLIDQEKRMKFTTYSTFPIIHHAPLQNCCGPGPEKSLLKAWFYCPAAVFKVQCTKTGVAFPYSDPLQGRGPFWKWTL